MSRELTPGQYWRSYVITEQCHRKENHYFWTSSKMKGYFLDYCDFEAMTMNLATFLLLYWKTLTPWCVLHCKCCLKPETEEHFHQVQNVQRLCACFCSWNQIQNLLNQVISNFTNCNLFDCSNWSTATDTFSEILDDLEKTKWQGCHQTLI